MPLDQSIIRITKELGALQTAPDLSLAVACRDIDVRHVMALVIGPHETPYEFGFFEFSVQFPDDYPSKAPSVVSRTTNDGRCRFNPNIYSNGKVCLSILGTWRGERGEEWSSAQGLESILLSIQSLMSANPYENEPGYENARSSEDKKAQKNYAQKIQHETLRISVIQRLESYLGISQVSIGPGPQTRIPVDPEDVDESDLVFEPFKDLCKSRFLWYYDSYLAAIHKGKKEVKEGESFTQMRFESYGGNSMDGHFAYNSLERRLRSIKAALDKETHSWEAEGLEARKSETTVASNLEHQYVQVVSRIKQRFLPHDVTLENGNQFVWLITYFGQPTTSLDGGLFRIKINFSPRFPREQPRVKLLTNIFHHLVSPDGTVCYSPNPDKKDDVWSHIEAIFSVLNDDDPAYDPRKLVNPEATNLFWNSGKEGKRLYNRRLRRSVQQSMEEFPE